MSVHPNRRQARPAPLEQLQRVGRLCRKAFFSTGIDPVGVSGGASPDAGGTRQAGGGTPGTAPQSSPRRARHHIAQPHFYVRGLRDMWSSPSCRIAGGSLEGIRGENFGGAWEENVRKVENLLKNIENLPVRWYE